MIPQRAPSAATRAAAALHMFLGVAFGLGTPPVLLYFARNGELPMSPFGWRYMSGGPFQQLTPEQFAGLGWVLVGVCALDVLAGTWLWQGRRRGFRLGMATNGPAFLLGIGFGPPLLLLGVPIRAALAVAGRHSLR